VLRRLRRQSRGQSAKRLAARRGLRKNRGFGSCRQVFSLHVAVHTVATHLTNSLHDQRLSAKRQHDDGGADYIGTSSRPGPDSIWESHVRRGETTEASSRPHEAVKASGRPRCTQICDSLLQMVCWWRNAKALHLVKQRGALQAKSGSCSSRTSELPIGALARGENLSTHLVFKGGV
jgi:hypothetical protein